MRILNVTAQKPDSTGSGTYLAETVRCQLAAGHEVAVVCGVGAHDIIDLPTAVRVTPVRFDTSELPFHVVGMSDAMPYLATRYRDLTPEMAERFKAAFTAALREADAAFAPDAVICHHLYLVTALARAVLPHRRIAAVCHSTDLRQLRKHGLERAFIIDGVRRLDAVLALHDAQRAEIAELFGIPVEDIHIVGTGYNDRVFNGGAPGLGDAGGTGPSARPACLLYVGKISLKKGVASLVRAYGALPAEVGPTELVLVGGHGDAAEYEEIAALVAACPRPVRLTGALPTEQLVAAYRAADVFVLPSFYEGLPLVTIEALACGCKVVVTDLPGVRPFLDAQVPGAPVRYVGLPRMRDVDTPDPAELPAFEADLARALCATLAEPWCPCDLTGVTWRTVTERIVRLAAGACPGCD